MTLGHLKSPPTLLALFGLLVIGGADGAAGARRAAAGDPRVDASSGSATGLVHVPGVVSAPPSLAPTFLQLDVVGALQPAMLPVIFVFFFLALFDSVGTLVGVATQAGLMRDGTLPRARAGAARRRDRDGRSAPALGTSTVTAYIESATGVAAGGRTGLANVVTASLFFLSLFFFPLVQDDRRRLRRSAAARRCIRSSRRRSSSSAR